MLYIALVLSLICWFISLRTIARNKSVLNAAVGFFCLCMAPMMLMTAFPMVWLLAIGLTVLMIIWRLARLSYRSYRNVSLLGLFALFGGCSLQSYYSLRNTQETYPAVSLAERLPARTPSEETSPISLSTQAQQNLQTLDEMYDHKDRYDRDNLEVYQAIHERAFQVFATSPGFGVTRMPLTFSMLVRLKYRNRKESVSFASSFVPLPISVGEVDELPTPKFTNFHDWLLDSIFRFVPVSSLGHRFADQRVAGFVSHGRQNYAKEPENWNSDSLGKEYARYQVHRLELIGLLLHEHAVAYVSDQLPSMDELKQLKTRPLDAFEQVGLVKLQAGEDLYVKEHQKRTLVLGALRNAKQCQSCHEGERGKLLGAFRYELERKDVR
jgi:hypothetical protein